MSVQSQPRELPRALALAALSAVVLAVAGRVAQPGFAVLLLPALAAGWLALDRLSLTLSALVFVTYCGLTGLLTKYHGIPATFQLLVAGTVVVIAYHAVFRQFPLDRARSFLALTVPYWSTLVLSGVLSAHTEVARESVERMSKAMVVGLLCAVLVRQLDDFRVAIRVLLLAGVVMTSVTTFQGLTASYSTEFGGLGRVAEVEEADGMHYRIAGPLGDPNFYGALLVVLLPLALDRVRGAAPRLDRFLGAAFLLTGVLSIGLTFSRGTFLGAVAGLGFWMFRRRPSKRLLAAGVAVVAIGALFAPERYLDRLSSIPDAARKMLGEETGESNDVNGRVSEWLVAMDMLQDHPMIGIGPGNYAIEYQSYSQQLGLDTRLEEREAHGLFMEIGAETGLLGLMTFSVLLGLVGRRLLRWTAELDSAGERVAADLAWAFLAGLVANLVCSVFLHEAFPFQRWVLLGIAIGVTGGLRSHAQQPEPEGTPVRGQRRAPEEARA